MTSKAEDLLTLPTLLEVASMISVQLGRPRPGEDDDTIRRIDLSVGQWVTVMTGLTALALHMYGEDGARGVMHAVAGAYGQ